VEDIRRFEAELYRHLDNSKPDLLNAIREKRELNDDIKGQLKSALTDFKTRFKGGASGEEKAAKG
jgi:F-type H+-transporting ATPase subunit alpha